MKKRGLKEPSLPKELFPVKLGKEFLEEAKEQETEVVRRKIEKVYLTKFEAVECLFGRRCFKTVGLRAVIFTKLSFRT